MSVRAVAVHQGLALLVKSVLLQHGSELVGRPVAIESVPGILILNQPIAPLKVLLLVQIDPVDLGGLHLPLQHLCAKRITFACQSKKINHFNTCVQKGSKFTCV
jgi:hypothetical protein